MPIFWRNEPESAFWQNEPEACSVTRDCFAEPVIGPAKGRTRWLAMTADVVVERQMLSLKRQMRGARRATKQSSLPLCPPRSQPQKHGT